MIRCLAFVIGKTAGVGHMLYALAADHNGDGSDDDDDDARMLHNSQKARRHLAHWWSMHSSR